MESQLKIFVLSIIQETNLFNPGVDYSAERKQPKSYPQQCLSEMSVLHQWNSCDSGRTQNQDCPTENTNFLSFGWILN